jgi:predicted nucleic acid-binding protein
MNRKVIVDTGILVALQNKNDHYHRWAVDMLAKVAPPLLTCEAVISETCFLLRDFKKSDVLFSSGCIRERYK